MSVQNRIVYLMQPGRPLRAHRYVRGFAGRARDLHGRGAALEVLGDRDHETARRGKRHAGQGLAKRDGLEPVWGKRGAVNRDATAFYGAERANRRNRGTRNHVRSTFNLVFVVQLDVPVEGVAPGFRRIAYT